MSTDLSIQTYVGPVVVTITYVALYYVTMGRIARTKRALHSAYRARGEKFDRYFGQDREMLAADRAQLNMLEHMPPFLALLWLNAVFVSPIVATIAGGIYVASRIIHPFMVGRRLGRDVQASILLITGPGYAVLTFLLGALVWRVWVG